MIFATTNIKGGAGKSAFASHLIPEYILRKGKQKSIKLFEFDSYNKTSKEFLGNSRIIETEVIGEEDIQEKIFDVLFDSKEEDVILDVGAGSLVSQIVSVAKKSLLLDQLVFVVPYSNDGVEPLLETITLIENAVDNPKILIVLNKLYNSSFLIEKAKEKAISLYGIEKYQIEPCEHLDRLDKYVRAAIPFQSFVFSFAAADKASLVDLKVMYMATKDLNEEELEEFWRSSGGIKGKKITREEFKRGKVLMQRQLESAIFLDECSGFFLELEKFECEK